ncbi:MAG: DUF4157 domain-containing protein [Pseudomonadota bacterium]
MPTNTSQVEPTQKSAPHLALRGPGGDGASDALAPSLTDPLSDPLAGYTIMRQPAGSAAPGGDPRGPFQAATSGGADPLPYRAEMEGLFGQGFGGVRAHLGRGAALGAIGAKAAARGDTVAFAERSPSRETVGHELAHVAQARASGGGGVQALGGLSDPSSLAEREAGLVGRAVARGEPVEVHAAPAGAVQTLPVGIATSLGVDKRSQEASLLESIEANFRAMSKSGAHSRSDDGLDPIDGALAQDGIPPREWVQSLLDKGNEWLARADLRTGARERRAAAVQYLVVELKPLVAKLPEPKPPAPHPLDHLSKTKSQPNQRPVPQKSLTGGGSKADPVPAEHQQTSATLQQHQQRQHRIQSIMTAQLENKVLGAHEKLVASVLTWCRSATGEIVVAKTAVDAAQTSFTRRGWKDFVEKAEQATSKIKAADAMIEEVLAAVVSWLEANTHVTKAGGLTRYNVDLSKAAGKCYPFIRALGEGVSAEMGKGGLGVAAAPDDDVASLGGGQQQPPPSQPIEIPRPLVLAAIAQYREESHVARGNRKKDGLQHIDAICQHIEKEAKAGPQTLADHVRSLLSKLQDWLGQNFHFKPGTDIARRFEAVRDFHDVLRELVGAGDAAPNARPAQGGGQSQPAQGGPNPAPSPMAAALRKAPADLLPRLAQEMADRYRQASKVRGRNRKTDNLGPLDEKCGLLGGEEPLALLAAKIDLIRAVATQWAAKGDTPASRKAAVLALKAEAEALMVACGKAGPAEPEAEQEPHETETLDDYVDALEESATPAGNLGEGTDTTATNDQGAYHGLYGPASEGFEGVGNVLGGGAQMGQGIRGMLKFGEIAKGKATHSDRAELTFQIGSFLAGSSDAAYGVGKSVDAGGGTGQSDILGGISDGLEAFKDVADFAVQVTDWAAAEKLGGLGAQERTERLLDLAATTSDTVGASANVTVGILNATDAAKTTIEVAGKVVQGAKIISGSLEIIHGAVKAFGAMAQLGKLNKVVSAQNKVIGNLGKQIVETEIAADELGNRKLTTVDFTKYAKLIAKSEVLMGGMTECLRLQSYAQAARRDQQAERRSGLNKMITGGLDVAQGGLLFSGVGAPVALALGIVKAIWSLGGAVVGHQRNKNALQLIEIAKDLKPDGTPTGTRAKELDFGAARDRVISCYNKYLDRVFEGGSPPGLDDKRWKTIRGYAWNDKNERVSAKTTQVMEKTAIPAAPIHQKSQKWIVLKDSGVNERSKSSSAWFSADKSDIARKADKQRMARGLIELAASTFDPTTGKYVDTSNLVISEDGTDLGQDMENLRKMTGRALLESAGIKESTYLAWFEKAGGVLGQTSANPAIMKSFIQAFVMR